MTRVLNLRCDDCSTAVRIDRASKWGNPFVIGRDGNRDAVCDKYAAWFEKQPHLVNALHELAGRDLACWCHPLRCHGHFLMYRANQGTVMSERELQSWTVKHRPQTTDELIAPESMLDAIDERIKLRDEHAYFISGPTGCGKTTLSAMLAHGMARVPYGEKSSDIIQVNAGAESTIEHTRKLVETSRFLPTKTGGRKVIWIEEAHSYLEKAATPLLRAVEDSPKSTVWIFATNRPEKVLQTLRDRCYPFKLDLPPVPELRKLLLRVLREENKLQNWEKADRAKLVNAIALGSGQIPRAALGMLKSAVDQSKNYKTVDDLIAAPVLSTPTASMDQAAIKILLALLVRHTNGKNVIKQIFNAALMHDGYALLSRMLWLSSAVFLEQATGVGQPGNYYFSKAALEIDAIKNMEPATVTAAMGTIYARLTTAQVGVNDFSVDPKHLLYTALIGLHEAMWLPTGAE